MTLQWSPTGKPVVPKNHTPLRQGFGGSSADQRNPPKHDTIIAYGDSIRGYAFLHGQGRGLPRRRMIYLFFSMKMALPAQLLDPLDQPGKDTLFPRNPFQKDAYGEASVFRA